MPVLLCGTGTECLSYEFCSGTRVRALKEHHHDYYNSMASESSC